MQIRRSVQCPVCGTNYFEGEGAGCPKCSGLSSGVSRPLSGGAPTMAPAAASSTSNRGGARQEFDPVCGWLVCLGEVDNGRYLRLFNGKNSIGGGRECMLPLDFVPGIHKGVSAAVLYDRKLNRFWMINASGRDIVRVNGELLLAPVELLGGEMLEIGGTPFRFVPLCGAKFGWG